MKFLHIRLWSHLGHFQPLQDKKGLNTGVKNYRYVECLSFFAQECNRVHAKLSSFLGISKCILRGRGLSRRHRVLGSLAMNYLRSFTRQVGVIESSYVLTRLLLLLKRFEKVQIVFMKEFVLFLFLMRDFCTVYYYFWPVEAKHSAWKVQNVYVQIYI
jgi:hypothetical protein